MGHRLEQVHGVVQTGTQTESMKTQFLGAKAAMIVDGPWNWAPTKPEDPAPTDALAHGRRDRGTRGTAGDLQGLVRLEQSPEKVWATELALHSSMDVQRTFASETYTLPTHVDLYEDADIVESDVLSASSTS